jgi:hypothetical protein
MRRWQPEFDEDARMTGSPNVVAGALCDLGLGGATLFDRINTNPKTAAAKLAGTAQNLRLTRAPPVGQVDGERLP